MSHYVCTHCGTIFSEEDAATETFRHDEIRPTFVENFIVCPSCLSADFDDAAYCYHCKQPMKYEKLLGGYYCKDCMRELTDRYHEKRFCLENADEYAEWLHDLRQRNNADEQDEKDKRHL